MTGSVGLKYISRFFLFWIALLCFTSVWAQYNIGVYYYPGWKDNAEQSRAHPWDPIKRYPEREPLLGWYDEGDLKVAEQHLQWMSNSGIDFVVYDWYWTKDCRPRIYHAIEAYLTLANRHGVKFSIIWANHSNIPQDLHQFDSMVQYWIGNLVVDKDFYRIDGKPVVFIFSPNELDKNAATFKESGKSLIDRANAAAKAAGLKGFYFVGSTGASSESVKALQRSGYSAASAYNYHTGPASQPEGRRPSQSYGELIAGYKEAWAWFVENSPIPYILPITAGWDKRPWQEPGIVDSHDQSYGDVARFKDHLKSARSLMEKFPAETQKTAVICCWNEFGEGSYIEPTKYWKFGFLDDIKDVFPRK